jgi:membrane protein
LTVLRTAVERFNASRGSQAAASLSYYAFFSLFPLLLFILLAAGSIVGEARVYDQLVQVISGVLPVGREVVAATIDQVRQHAGGLQILAVLGLLWSGTGFFTAIVLNIDLAWPDVKAANLVRQRLLALLMVVILLLLILLSLLLNIIAGLRPQGQSLAPALQERVASSLWPLVTRLLPFLVAFVLFLGLYWGVPKAKVRPQAAAGGAFVAALGWQLASWGFSWVIRTGLANYEVVYGSLGAVVALLFWMYLSSWILLFGAHLTAAIDRRSRPTLQGGALRL